MKREERKRERKSERKSERARVYVRVFVCVRDRQIEKTFQNQIETGNGTINFWVP